MKIKLLGRTDRKAKLVVETELYSTYKAAVETGQQRYGHGNFMVDTGHAVPTRDEQLLKTTICKP